ncbi:ABC transporter ATP-binding protein [Salisediminibacterium halotolerans]|uniref:ABC transporter ATP-binding protein n=1 Tax=Salisediminibacterium halotolerans TaxID=517425 RepID=UPI000EB1710E|nr:ABC transporter ATP-binding protein [Salisediminibacterium halotolerans]RLJ71804.1 ATP-binding cassette subfamily B protein [Actinophytocola xinjiangensis]RPE86954.1 ATP-binding cassette subfamily B protein [Salisediminibacterium halotolerans]TWG33017.1 ATP-binding cassette subfamily B protein [Salisediminibacterium halotolerans]GEL08914.1 putative ABC transporter ATP-binding protein YfiC [Salisediminibacterium halotolerans]
MNKWTEPFRYERIQLNQTWEDNDLQTETAPAKRAEDFRGTAKRIWQLLSERKMSLYLVILMVALSSFFSLAGPFVVGMSIDWFVEDGDVTNLIYALIVLAVIYLCHSLTVFLQHFWMIKIAQETVYHMRIQLFHHMQKLPIPFFDRRRHGELMSRLTNDMDNVSNMLNSSVIQIIQSVLTLAGVLTVMLYLSPLLTLVTLTIIPAMYVGMKWITKRTGKLFKAQQRHLGDMNGYLQETMSGQKVIKSFSQEDRVIAGFEERNVRLRLAAFWAQVISGFIPKLMNMLNNFSFAIIAGAGGLFVLYDMITIGVIVIFAEYARQFTRPLNDLANQFNTLLSAIAGAERVFNIIDEPDEVTEEADKKELVSLQGGVSFENVSFAYDNDEWILNRLSFQASPGETVAFVGPTGAGKTTIISLLSRFYSPTTGLIRFDGEDVTNFKRESVRNNIAFVLQDSYLFEGTIRENIRYGRLNATDAEIEEAAVKANAHSFIRRFPDGYQTRIDSEGGGISQGQKQLLSIARALLADPDILVLDEATSSIDTVTEIKIQQALNILMKGRTSFIIAHRLNTVRSADQILVLNEGEIVERGNHEQLLNKNGFYADLYASHLKEKSG